MINVINICMLRNSLHDYFPLWDDYALENNMRAARNLRREIFNVACGTLDLDAARAPGLYVFIDQRADGMDGVKYIGIANTVDRPIGRRLEDRFRDDNSLDIGLDNLPEADQHHRMHSRLSVALPKTDPNYIAKHGRTAMLMRSSSHVIMIGGDFAARDIRKAAKCLIGSAVVAGANLHNRASLGYRRSTSGEARRIAIAVIDACRQFSFDAATADLWTELAVDTRCDPRERN